MSEDLKSKVIDTIDSLIPKGRNSLDLRTTDMVYGISRAKEAVLKLFNAESTQKSVVPTQDCISRQAAIDEVCKMMYECFGADEEELDAIEVTLHELPSADIDLSDYSDRLWRKAYEQGKADAEPEREKGKWIRKDDYCNGIIMRVCKCSACSANAGIGEDGFWYKSNYCPNCGAEMEKGEADAETG